MPRALRIGCAVAVICSQAMSQKLPSDVHVVGKVLNLSGRPLVGAMVALIPANPDEAKIARTSIDGSFSILTAPENYSLTITFPGCLPYSNDLNLKPGQGPRSIKVNLPLGGYRIQGTVVPAKEHVLKDVRLHFHKMRGYDFFANVKQGHFDLNLAPGAYIVDATAEGQFFIGYRFDLLSKKSDVKIYLKSEPTPAGADVRAWIKAKAIPITTVSSGHGFGDLQPLEAVVGNAQVVGLGEATHGTKEFFQLKHRMLEFLVEKKGFTLFTMESLMPESYAVDDYLQTGKGDPAKALAGLVFWTWDTEEVLDMIHWMRKYNENPAHKTKLRFYGLDMQGLKMPYAQAKAWLDKVAPDEAAHLMELHDRMMGLSKSQGHDPSEASFKEWRGFARETNALAQRMGTKLTSPGQALPTGDVGHQIQNIRILAQYAALKGQSGRGLRDQFMAKNLEWILSQNKGAKAVVWAHNGHICFQEGADYGANPMGWYLRKSLGQNYRSFGFAFREGGFRAVNDESGNYEVASFEVKPNDKGTLDGALASTHLPILALNLRNLPKGGPVRTWFEAPQGTWDIPADYADSLASRCIQKTSITGCYDALLFVNRTSPSKPNQAQSEPAGK